jgi:hypothetical protein
MTAGSILFTRGEDPLRADKLNAAFAERLLVVGDTMLGPLVLFRDPQVPFEAVTKQYTDALVTGKLTGFLSTTGGTMYGPLFLFRAPQTAMEASTKQYTDAKAASVAAGYLPLTGGTLTGNLTLAGDAVTQLQPVTLRQLSTLGSTASIAVGDTPPAPGLNKLWWDSVACQLYIWFDDGTSAQWVPAMAVPASIGEAPSNGSVYARQSGQWTDIGTTSLSKNLLHNSLFNIAQRGAGAFTTNSTYTLDRWVLGVALDTASIVRFNTTDADKAAIGDEAAVNYLQNSFTGNAGASASNYIEQRIEGVRRLSGKTVTVSFWAVGTGPKLGVNMYQLFGSGGSPSAYVQALATGAAISVGGTWARYTVTIPIPSTAGKTLGSNGDDYTILRFYCSAGATQNQQAGNIGVQSGTINIWGVQLEIGNIATALEKIDPQQDLAKCQRFYQMLSTISVSAGPGASTAGLQTFTHVTLPVTMRAAPSLSLPVASSTNCSATGALNVFAQGFDLYITSLAAGAFFATLGTIYASADL